MVFIFNLSRYYHTLQIGLVLYQIIELIIRFGGQQWFGFSIAGLAKVVIFTTIVDVENWNATFAKPVFCDSFIQKPLLYL